MAEIPKHNGTPGCTENIPDSNGYVPPGTCGYHGKPYYPSFTLAMIFTAIACAILAGHVVQTSRYRSSGSQRFATAVSACLVVGYAARTVGTRDQQNVYLAAVSDTVVLVCPILISVLDSQVFVAITGTESKQPRTAGINRNNILQIGRTSLILLSGIQLLISTMVLTGNPSWLQVLGIHSYIFLISVQAIIMLVVLSAVLHYSVEVEDNHVLKASDDCQKRVLISAGCSMFFVLFRILYRIIELSQVFQHDSTLPHSEKFFYALETTPVFVAISVWCFVPVAMADDCERVEDSHDYQELGTAKIGGSINNTA